MGSLLSSVAGSAEPAKLIRFKLSGRQGKDKPHMLLARASL